MDLIDPVSIGCLIIGAVMGCLLGMVALCNAPRGAEEDVAAFRAGYRAGYRKGLAQSLARPGDEA